MQMNDRNELVNRYNTGISYLMVERLSHKFSSEFHVRQFKVRVHYNTDPDNLHSDH